jgi:hypothetical protein
MTPKAITKLNEIRHQVFSLDEESLWALVCSLFPEAAEETLEDIYDALLSASRRDGSGMSADAAFREEDDRRGITR